MSKIIFFDLETGGLDKDSKPITQIGAIACDEAFNVLEEYERKVQFTEQLCDREALEITSYDPEVWAREAKHPSFVAEEFSEFLSRHATVEMTSRYGNPYMVAQLAGYNSDRFDAPFLQAWYKRRPDAKDPDKSVFLPASFQTLDVYQLAMWVFKMGPSREKLKNFKLETLREFFGIEVDEGGAHDAMFDARVVREVAIKLLGKGVST